MVEAYAGKPYPRQMCGYGLKFQPQQRTGVSFLGRSPGSGWVRQNPPPPCSHTYFLQKRICSKFFFKNFFCKI